MGVCAYIYILCACFLAMKKTQMTQPTKSTNQRLTNQNWPCKTLQDPAGFEDDLQKLAVLRVYVSLVRGLESHVHSRVFCRFIGGKLPWGVDACHVWLQECIPIHIPMFFSWIPVSHKKTWIPVQQFFRHHSFVVNPMP
jgi:hypothetical protein